MKITCKLAAVILTTSSLLAACGGGGGDDDTTTSATTTFPLASAYRARVLASSQESFTVTGSCTGTATQTAGTPTTGVSFEGKPAVSALLTLQISVPGCNPPSITDSVTLYLDPATGLPLGSVNATQYVVTTSSTPLPATVKVADTATVLTQTRYSNSTKATIIGSTVISYVVAPNDSNSAKVTVIGRLLNAAGQVEGTQQTVYRLGTDGSISVLMIDVQITNGVHLVLTRT